MPSFGKLAQLEAQINLAESGKHKGFLGRLTSTEAEGYQIASAKMAYKQAQSDLQSVCRLYGPSGMWELVVREQAAARVRKKKELEAQAARRDNFFAVLSVMIGVAVAIVGSVLLLYGVSFFAP
jgi:hypothetical protein